MEGAMEDLQDMFIVHTIEEVQVHTTYMLMLWNRLVFIQLPAVKYILLSDFF